MYELTIVTVSGNTFRELYPIMEEATRGYNEWINDALVSEVFFRIV